MLILLKAHNTVEVKCTHLSYEKNKLCYIKHKLLIFQTIFSDFDPDQLFQAFFGDGHYGGFSRASPGEHFGGGMPGGYGGANFPGGFSFQFG